MKTIHNLLLLSFFWCGFNPSIIQASESPTSLRSCISPTSPRSNTSEKNVTFNDAQNKTTLFDSNDHDNNRRLQYSKNLKAQKDDKARIAAIEKYGSIEQGLERKSQTKRQRKETAREANQLIWREKFVTSSRRNHYDPTCEYLAGTALSFGILYVCYKYLSQK